MTPAGTVNRRVPARGGGQQRPNLSVSSRPALDLVRVHLTGEGVPVHAERVGGLREAAVAAAENPRNEALFELADRIVEPDAAVHHFLDEALELLSNHRPRPVRRVNASRYFSRVFATTSSGSDGTGG